MGKAILRRGDVKTIKYYGKVQSEKRRCKTMKIPWESSIREEAM